MTLSLFQTRNAWSEFFAPMTKNARELTGPLCFSSSPLLEQKTCSRTHCKGLIWGSSHKQWLQLIPLNASQKALLKLDLQFRLFPQWVQRKDEWKHEDYSFSWGRIKNLSHCEIQDILQVQSHVQILASPIHEKRRWTGVSSPRHSSSWWSWVYF